MFFGRKKSSGSTEMSATIDRRLLEFEIVEAKGLIACVKNGTSDPYASCYLNDLAGREIKSETFTTKTQSGTLSPKYNEKFSFGKRYDLDTVEDLPSLTVALFHRAPYTVSEVPMGAVIIPLESLDQSGKLEDKWFPVESVGRMKSVSGEIHIKLKFNRSPTASIMEEEDETTSLVGGAKVADEENPDQEDMQPNELFVTVIQAKRLIIMDKNLLGSGGSSDPLVKLKIDGFDSKYTKYLRKTLNPVWNESFSWPNVTSNSLSLLVSVLDHDDFNAVKDKNMGKIAIPLANLSDKKPVKQWYKLKDKKLQVDGMDRGEVELAIHWKFNPALEAERLKKQREEEAKFTNKVGRVFRKIGQTLGTESESESEPDDDPEDNERQADTSRPETEEEKKVKEEEEKKKRQELQDIDIKDGDYQIQVHIIEARDLKAENLDGTSDPVVYVEVFDKKQNTQVIKGVTTCVFDDLFIFNMIKMDKQQFQEGLIRISVYDANFFKNTMIGAYAIDTTMVYTMNKDHEIYRKWVPLMDDEDPDDVGVQGYLKLSIQIIGPGEKLKVHDEEAEMAEELKREAAAGGDIGSLVLTTPTIRKDWNYVVASVYKCEGLPVMDMKIGASIATIQKAGTDAFCKLSFAGGKSLKLKPVTVKGENRTMINPEFNYEMWYPVSVPTMTQLIKFSVWDHDLDKSELIGNILEKYNIIDRTPTRSTELRWYNMYGAPEFKTASTISKIKSGARKFKSKVNQLVGSDIDWKEFYNNVPDQASTFKGRVLMKFRIESKRPPKYEAKAEVKPFKRRIKPMVKKFLPPTMDYVLKVLFVCGTELPSFGTVSNQKLRVRVCIGINELSTKPVPFENGLCRWNELLISEKIAFPIDYTQLPDIVIHLLKEDLKPVCFTRIKPTVDPKKTTLIGFHEPAKWYLLEEDKSIDALADDVFPGSILMKIGFGSALDASAAQPMWEHHLQMAKTGTPYQVRVHIYQGSELPAADSNGLIDPYIKVKFMGQKKKTKTIYKNRFPGFYETLIFDDVSIPDFENFIYASQVCFRLFDEDNFDSDDYMGTCNFNLPDAVLTKNPDDELPTPKWIPFFKEKPGDGEGSLLVMVQLIPTEGKQISKVAKSIVPSTRQAFIELLIIGCRDMKPYNFQEMQSPFIEIELNSFGTNYLSTTEPSKRPQASNPNFLERIVMPVRLPEESIFATPLQIRARDTRLGGYLKPVVGVSSIDLMHKIPWCKDTYKAPATDMFFTDNDESADAIGESGICGLPGANNDEIARKVLEEKSQREGELLSDDFIASPEPVNVEQYIQGRVAIEDSGAGVFGALNHIDTTGGSKKKKTGADMFDDPDWTQDDSDQPPAWSIGRKKLDSELEVEFLTTPFETYELTRGQQNGMFGSTLKVVGRLKGLVRVIEDENEPPMLSKELMDQLLKPKSYKVRLYVLRGIGFTPMDFDIFGKPAKSDPYLKVRLGKDEFNDRENAVDDMTDVDFYKLIEFNAELPGTSQLQIDVMDKDTIGKDDLIGRTTIDLEDRWFDKRWQDYGVENMKTPGSDPNDSAAVRWATKPVERRSVYVKNKSIAQGVVECWVDIMKPAVASTFPPDNVSLPPTQIFEVRVVIWKTKNVPPQDSFEGMSDLYVKCWPEGCRPQETDTHWRCKKGNASFNWRMLFDVELGHSTRAMKFPYFHLQLWDRDLLKWNDCAGEGVIDLRRFYRKAYKRNIAIKLFEKVKGTAAKRAARRKKTQVMRGEDIPDSKEDVPPEETEEDKKRAAEVINPLAGEAKKEERLSMVLPRREEVDSDDDDEEEEEEGKEELENKAPPSGQHMDRRLEAKPAARPQRTLWQRLFGPKKTKEELEAEAEEEKNLLESQGGVDDPLPEEKKDDDDAELKGMINTFKSMTGLWDIDPEDSSWYHLETTNHNDPTKKIPMGSICYSIQIWPKDKAVVMPVGAARNEPNTNPYCPPPVGRLRFSWNPFVLGSELCGPVLCAKFFCCFICLGFLALMIFCQPFLNIIINCVFLVY